MTDPRPTPDTLCAWCQVRAIAVPDEPPILWEGAWYHRRGCYQTARLRANGFLRPDHAHLVSLL